MLKTFTLLKQYYNVKRQLNDYVPCKDVKDIIETLFVPPLRDNKKLSPLDIDEEFMNGQVFNSAFVVYEDDDTYKPVIFLNLDALTRDGRVNLCRKRFAMMHELLHYAFFRRKHQMHHKDSIEPYINHNDKYQKDDFISTLSNANKHLREWIEHNDILASLGQKSESNNPALEKELQAQICATELLLPYPIRSFFQGKYKDSKMQDLWHQYLAEKFRIPKSIVIECSSEKYLKDIHEYFMKKEEYDLNHDYDNLDKEFFEKDFLKFAENQLNHLNPSNI